MILTVNIIHSCKLVMIKHYLIETPDLLASSEFTVIKDHHSILPDPECIAEIR